MWRNRQTQGPKTPPPKKASGSDPGHRHQKPPEGHRPPGDFYVKRTGIEPIAVEPAGGRFRPPVRTLGATSIFAKGKNVNRSRSPAPKIDKHRQGLVDFYLFTIHYSLFTKIEGSIFGKE